MNREIKFRGWDKYDKKMIYDLCQVDSFWHYYSYSDDTGLHFGKTGPNGVGEDFENKYIMQYTGLKDKNGKEIYEGDVLKQVKKSSREGCESSSYDKNNFEVVFKYGSFWLQRPYSDSVYIRDFPNIDEFVGFECFEVIGNIYENPELLEVDK